MNVSGLYIVKGDCTCDGRITMEDFVAINADGLGISTLTGDAFTGADTNSDNVIDIQDLASIFSHLLGTEMITEVVAK